MKQLTRVVAQFWIHLNVKSVSITYSKEPITEVNGWADGREWHIPIPDWLKYKMKLNKEKYFRIVFIYKYCQSKNILYIFCCPGIHHIETNMVALQISEMFTISPYVIDTYFLRRPNFFKCFTYKWYFYVLRIWYH